MTGQLRSQAMGLLAAATLFGSGLQASTLDPDVADAARLAAIRASHQGAKAETSICPDVTRVVPPVTIRSTMTTSACIYIGARDNAYSFDGIAGQTLSFDYYSTAFDVFMVLDGPSTLQGGQRQSYLSTSGISRITLTYTLPISGEYTIEAMTLFDYDDVTQPTTGPYTLSITLGEPATCLPDPGKLCLNNSRFAVSATWKTPDGTTGTGTAVPLTADTGYFWFFGPANVELVIKVLDGRGVNNKFWVFYGALSNVEYTITVVDTEKNITRTFTNPQGRLASVADTSAFNP